MSAMFPFERGWNRCVICNRFFSSAEFESGAIKRRSFSAADGEVDVWFEHKQCPIPEPTEAA